MDIIGLNSLFHDSAAVLLREGALVAGLEEERWFRDEPHTGRFPARSLRWLLEAHAARPAQITLGFRPWRSFAGGVDRAARRQFRAIRRATREAERETRRALRAAGLAAEVPLHTVAHHDAHAASAFFASPFAEAAVLTYDGSGEWDTVTISRGRGSRLTRLRTWGLPHSVGGVYAALTEHLGFRRNSDEYKVMGLAPAGDPGRFRNALAAALPLDEEGFRVEPWAFRRGPFRLELTPALRAQLGPARIPESELTQVHRDLAAAVQAQTEVLGLHLARSALRLASSKRLALAGGVGLNCVLNGRIAREAGAEALYVQPLSSDAGVALGSASWVWHQVLGRPRVAPLERLDLGPESPNAEVEALLRAGRLRWSRPDDLVEACAALLAAGQVVGWFQGRAELGPRALGQRSILADPTRPEMRDHLNARVKRREGFRPFAPAVAAESAADYFAPGGDAFMTRAVQVLPGARGRLPAVTHIDGSARVQLVRAAEQPRFHALLRAFERRRGVPILLNTSFNVRGEPMVLTPRDALRCFFTTGIDHLVIGDCIVNK